MSKKIQSAMDIARRMAGGRVGYADGGAPQDNWLTSAYESAKRGVANHFETGKQDWLERSKKPKIERFLDELGSISSRLNETAKFVAPYVPGWNTPPRSEYDAELRARLAERDGMSPMERTQSLGGQFAGEALPFILPELGAGTAALIKTAPKTSRALIGGAGVLGFPSGAGADDATKKLQTELKKAGYYNGPIDGNNGEQTQKAIAKRRADEIDADNREIEKLKLKTKGQETAAKEKGNERIRDLEKDRGYWDQAIHDYGPMLGYGAGLMSGVATRGLTRGLSDTVSSKAATRAGKLIEDISGKDVATRAARLNQFWSEGAPMGTPYGERLPFPSDTNVFPAFRANTEAIPSSKLYNPSVTKNTAIDVGAMTPFGLEAGAGQFLLIPDAEKELGEARKAVEADPSEVNIARWQAADKNLAFARFVKNMGQAGVGGYVLGMGKMRRNHERPDIAAAEAEKIKLDSALTALRNPQAVSQLTGKSPLPGTLLQTERQPLPIAGPESSSLFGPQSRAVGPSADIDKALRTATGQSQPIPREGLAPETGVPANPPAAFSPPTRFEPHDAVAPPMEERASSSVLQDFLNTLTPQDIAILKSGQTGKTTHGKGGKFSSQSKEQQRLLEDLQKRAEDFEKNRASGGRVQRAMDIARRALGGAVLSGPITHRADGGRTDTIPADVEAGAYIVPAAAVSHVGESDTNAGYQRLLEMFPEAGERATASGETVPVIVAGGEFAIPPSALKRIGGGDIKRGHDLMDQWVKSLIKDHAKTLANLPGPVKS